MEDHEQSVQPWSPIRAVKARMKTDIHNIGDGRCFTQPLLASDVTSGHASATQLGGAAYTLFHRCVIEKGIGGIAANLGKLLFRCWASYSQTLQVIN